MADWTQNLVTIEVPKEAAETVEVSDASVLEYGVAALADSELISSTLSRMRGDVTETMDAADYTFDIGAGTLTLDSSIVAVGDVFQLSYSYRFHLRLWTGVGSVTVGGNTYPGGGQALGVSEYENTTGDPDRRLQIRLSGIPKDLRAQFLQDSGPLPVTVGWIYSQDRGGTWAEAPISFRGRLSSPTMSEGVLTVEVETQRGDVDRGLPLRWSHEDQQRRFPGDEGLEHMRALSQQGVESSWPP